MHDTPLIVILNKYRIYLYYIQTISDYTYYRIQDLLI
jgi:hypothetical protein